MSIVGVGIDLVSIPDFAEQVDQPGTVFAETFTPGERRDASDKSSSAARHLAARWAAKEAVIKAWSGSRFSQRPVLREDIHRDIEVVTDMWGRPRVRLTGEIAEHLADVTIHVSLTHEGDTAAAVAILETAAERVCVQSRRLYAARATKASLDMSDLSIASAMCCRRCAAISRTWSASNRCGPTRPAATRCSAAPKRSADLLSQAGFGDVRIVSEGGAPAVIAHHPAPPGRRRCCCTPTTTCSPRVTPASGRRRRSSPTERDGRLYGRGSADDKAGIATHLAAFRAHGGQPPVGVTVFVEGEEESGSPSLGRLLAAHRDALAADVIVIADSDNWSTEIPALTVSLRGLADCVVEVATLDHGLHSGCGAAWFPTR